MNKVCSWGQEALLASLMNRNDKDLNFLLQAWGINKLNMSWSCLDNAATGFISWYNQLSWPIHSHCRCYWTSGNNTANFIGSIVFASTDFSWERVTYFCPTSFNKTFFWWARAAVNICLQTFYLQTIHHVPCESWTYVYSQFGIDCSSSDTF